MGRLWLVSEVACGLCLSACGDAGSGGQGDTTTGSASSTTQADPTEVSTTPGPTATTVPMTTGSDASSQTASGTDGGTADTGTTGGPSICMGEFPAKWQDGTDCGAEDPIQVHQYDDDTFVLRQSLCTSFEGPFLYMLFGQDRVLLEDTGDGGIPVDDVVYGVIDQWLADNGKDSIELVVVNSHGHGDHVQGNPLFMGQPNTTVVSPSVPTLQQFFEIANWPDDIASYDLGGRVIDVIPIPGHQQAHIALWDESRGLLLTGDTLYPGRLYINTFSEYVASIHRMVDHIADAEVCWVLGTHIEMTNTPGVDFMFGATEHPDEHPLQLGSEHLVELRDAVDAMVNPTQEVHDDFIIYPL